MNLLMGPGPMSNTSPYEHVFSRVLVMFINYPSTGYIFVLSGVKLCLVASNESNFKSSVNEFKT